MDELGVLHGVERLVVGGLECLGRTPLQRGDGADRDPRLLAEERHGDIGGFAATDAAASREQREDRLEARTDTAGGHTRGQVRRRDLAAAGAAGLVEHVLEHLRDDRRDLDDLVTPCLAHGILRSEATMAVPAALGHDRDPVITAPGGKGLRVVPLCPGWPPGLRPVGLRLRRSFHGLSADGGCEEFVESAFNRAVSSRTFSWRIALCSRSRLISRVRLARLASRWHLRCSEASSVRSVLRSRASSCSHRLSREDLRLATPRQSVDSSAAIRAERLRSHMEWPRRIPACSRREKQWNSCFAWSRGERSPVECSHRREAGRRSTDLRRPCRPTGDDRESTACPRPNGSSFYSNTDDSGGMAEFEGEGAIHLACGHRRCEGQVRVDEHPSAAASVSRRRSRWIAWRHRTDRPHGGERQGAGDVGLEPRAVVVVRVLDPEDTVVPSATVTIEGVSGDDEGIHFLRPRRWQLGGLPGGSRRGVPVPRARSRHVHGRHRGNRRRRSAHGRRSHGG